MKVCIIQPEYSTEYSRSDELFEKELELLEQCDNSMDLIVMPEACDIPCLTKTNEERTNSVNKYNKKMIEKAKETAIRCHSLVFINARYKAEGGYRNTTYAINQKGEVAGTYFKEHLTPGEVANPNLDSDYSFEYSEPAILEIDGVRYAFLTCYDFYFYENFSNIARYNVDVIIGCSHQRSDTHQALLIMSQFVAYNTNAYMIRSSVSMDENYDIGGASMVVAPDGTLLANMYSRVGMETVEIDVSKKYYKPAGFGNPPAAHYEYIEKGRRPWKYRPAGSAIVKYDTIMPYPRFCALGGSNLLTKENHMAAFGAAIAMGAEEIEFDIWMSEDGEIISNLDATRVIKLEEILEKFSCHAIMNIHLKDIDQTGAYVEAILNKIIDLIHRYDCRKYVYFRTDNETVLQQLKKLAPDICRCYDGEASPHEAVDRAIKYECKKIQLLKQQVNQEMIDKAHNHGIVCNVSGIAGQEEAKEFLAMGTDTMITKDYNLLSLRKDS